MIEGISDQIDHIDNALVSIKSSDLILKKDETTFLEDLKSLLKFFQEATEIFQVQYSPSIPKVIPRCQMPEKVIRILLFDNNVACNAMKKRSFTALESRSSYLKNSPLYIFSTMLSPQHKLIFTKSDCEIFNFDEDMYFLAETFREEIFERKQNYRCESNVGEKTSKSISRFRTFVS